MAVARAVRYGTHSRWTTEYASLSEALQLVGEFTDQLPGRQTRSLYLSAVTITTLGFGDVVPVTAGARFLVGTEALGGVIAAGLFLNAIANRVRRRTDPATSEASSEPSDGVQ
jgi:hypothetical protein